MREEVIELLKNNHLTLGSCESLTGGLFSSTVCSYPGVSSFFKGSIVSYSSLVKNRLVKIRQTTIDKYGVVSKQVAKNMAKNAKRLLDVDICISFTGNAGPSVLENKEVGLVYIGLAYQDKVMTFKKVFHGNRNQIREQVVDEGFKILKEFFSKTLKIDNKNN